MPKSSSLTLRETIRWQRRIIRHDNWVVRTAKHHNHFVVKWCKAQLLWTTRELHESLKALQASTVLPHEALWECIHNLEAGNWHDFNSGHNGHYGGLQMHPDWGYGTSYYASSDSEYVQKRAAERGFAASNYSTTWLLGQWNHPQCLIYA